MKIKINGLYYLHFNDVVLASSLDSVASTFAFTAKYDPANAQHRELFKPLSFHKVEMFDDDDKLLFTGEIVNNGFKSSAVPELVTLSGYSFGGVLEDCTIPYGAYPLESLDRSLKEIAERLLKYFGLKLIIYDNVKAECNQIYTKSVAELSGSVKDYLARLASQRNVVLSHDTTGNVILYRPDAKALPKGFFTKENTLNMGFEIMGQGMHSTLTTIRQPSKKDAGVFAAGNNGLTATDTITNPLVKKYRPHVDVLSSGSETDTSKGVRNTLASELKNIKLGFELNRWEDIGIGDVVEVQNDECYINKRTRFMVESTSRAENTQAKTQVFTLVLPETFTGEQPKLIFT